MKAQANNKVSVHYKGTLDDGTTFDESYNGEPLNFTIGEGHLLKMFEDSVIGMEVGEKKTIIIPAEEGYGKRTDELVITLQKENIPDGMVVNVGDKLQLELAPEMQVNVIVTELNEDNIVLDANHELADNDLTFEIELLSIE